MPLSSLARRPRHVTSFAHLSPQAGEFGDVLHRLSRALETVTGCVKTYVMQFSEAEGYSTCTCTWCRDYPAILTRRRALQSSHT
jgi:hypothetical protein